ncbi:LANO_0D07096g1_1 [Lachancea nothofagi CBS 11611]|uniref:LANO_0D07096g1_1 n=1 Tax=Lachancea nothofagi CBS 11611 TaxID=1266666 RepID=A0A1G4JHS7_9SACH|nr:LANO_0D07096g1_1 [Lachancea nothofagi CBS 11611]
MFTIKLNEQLVATLESLKNESVEVQDFLESGSIPMRSLLALRNQYREDVKLTQLLSPLEFCFKPRPIKGSDYSEEFKKQLGRLRLEQDEKEYQDMVRRDKLATFHDDEALTPAQMSKQVKEQITTVFNILVSVVSVVFAAWYWSGSSAGMKPHNRIFLCLFGGILILVAEVVVYNSYLRKIDEARVRERSKKEVKTVVEKL